MDIEEKIFDLEVSTRSEDRDLREGMRRSMGHGEQEDDNSWWSGFPKGRKPDLKNEEFC